MSDSERERSPCSLCHRETVLQNSYCEKCKMLHYEIKCGNCHFVYCSDCNDLHLQEYGILETSKIKVSKGCYLCHPK